MNIPSQHGESLSSPRPLHSVQSRICMDAMGLTSLDSDWWSSRSLPVPVAVLLLAPIRRAAAAVRRTRRSSFATSSCSAALQGVLLRPRQAWRRRDEATSRGSSEREKQTTVRRRWKRTRSSWVVMSVWASRPAFPRTLDRRAGVNRTRRPAVGRRR